MKLNTSSPIVVSNAQLATCLAEPDNPLQIECINDLIRMVYDYARTMEFTPCRFLPHAFGPTEFDVTSTHIAISSMYSVDVFQNTEIPNKIASFAVPQVTAALCLHKDVLTVFGVDIHFDSLFQFSLLDPTQPAHVLLCNRDQTYIPTNTVLYKDELFVLNLETVAVFGANDHSFRRKFDNHSTFLGCAQWMSVNDSGIYVFGRFYEYEHRIRRNQVQQFTHAGVPVKTYEITGLTNVTREGDLSGACVDNGFIYLADQHRSCIHVFDARSCERVTEYACGDRKPGNVKVCDHQLYIDTARGILVVNIQ